MFHAQKRYEVCNFSKYFFIYIYIAVLWEKYLHLEMQNLGYIRPELCTTNDLDLFYVLWWCFLLFVWFGLVCIFLRGNSVGEVLAEYELKKENN